MVKTVLVETIPHGIQAYDTIGDWKWDSAFEAITIFTSDLGDWRMSMCCAVHELVETLLCVNDGVDEEDGFRSSIWRTRRRVSTG